ncbi:MAG: DNA translocase FtsK 4TM domain-containing protein [Bacteroidaceae bacterium]|nr:DNA translocase FtsK 4TM domain-containing protein [Bacteroidaceae bacterium]
MADKKTSKKEDIKKEKKEIKWIQTLRNTIKNETTQFVVGLLCVMVALYMILAFSSFILNGGADQSALEQPTATEQLEGITDNVKNSTGKSGAHIAQLLINNSFGVSAYSIAVFLLLLGLNLMRTYKFNLKHWGICCATILVWGSLLLSITVDRWFTGSGIYWGGYHGHNVTEWLDGQFGMPGIIILLLVVAILFAIYLTSNTIEFIRKLLHPKSLLPGQDEIETPPTPSQAEEPQPTDIDFTIAEQPATEIEWSADTPLEEPVTITENEMEMEIVSPAEEESDEEIEPIKVIDTPATSETEFTIEINEEEEAEKIIEPYNPRLDLSRYKFPVIDLLNKAGDDTLSVDRDEQNAKKDSIIQALRNFGIEISSIKATVGPTITLYEITPAPGVRISKIKNLEDDIALTLAAFSTRIIAPMPGKGTIGIEIPNANPQIVSMHSVIGSRKFQECTYELPVAIGKTITNEIFMFDLAKMPHLLVAGATGMGKSVGLNAIITSLLYKKHPAELKLVMVDPKKVELSIYSTIEKHFLAKLPDGEDAIITDVTKVVQTLKSLCVEMDTRYDLLKAAGVRNLREYNEKFINRTLNPEKGHKYMPYIVVIIDEFGDLIMTAGKEVELPIARIAQLARAVGIHMIIATQRPTTNIITGTIKANFPARIAFRVSAMIDSRTILDRPGANQLIGRGDMLFLQGSDPVRVQCAFVDTPEVERIGDYIGQQQGYPTAFYLPEYVDENAGDGSNLDDVDLKRLDPMFEDAARLVVIHQSGSTSLIQRKFSIGYNRAGRIMDQLEKAGIVGPVDGSKPRQVLCADEMDLEFKLKALNEG